MDLERVNKKKGNKNEMHPTHLLPVVGRVGQHCRDVKHQFEIFIGGVERVSSSRVRCKEHAILSHISV